MLMHIYIRDLATIECLQLELVGGCTMITGETGAGKSIFIEAIELALGGRSSQSMIRPGKDKAEVSLTFDLTHFPHVIEMLEALDLHHTRECIIRRVITGDGRSRCYINGSPVTLQLTKEVGEHLFHLHGQHEQQVLLKPDAQRDMLDRYADQLPLALKLKHLAERWRHLEEEKQLLHAKAHERQQRCDYLTFQLEELLSLQLKAGEWAQLETEHHRLTHAGELIRHMQVASHLLNDDEQHSALRILHETRKAFEAVVGLEPKVKSWLDTLQNALIQLTDVAAELQDYLENTAIDPEKLKSIEDRVSLIFNLSRKHKIAPQELVAFTANIQKELTLEQASDEILAQMTTEQKNIADTYYHSARQLNTARQSAARKLEKEITTTIRSLSLPHGEFKITLEPIHEKNDALPLHGLEKISFQIKTNPDQPLQALAKGISGGELSRLSLALHLALAHRVSIPTLVFDEVDTGLSGATAEKIGRLLQKLGLTYQVFCVTHQPQVAACGQNHLLVEKCFIKNVTHTQLRLLQNDEKTREIARMLGGETITAKTLAHAKEVLEKAEG